LAHLVNAQHMIWISTIMCKKSLADT